MICLPWVMLVNLNMLHDDKIIKPCLNFKLDFNAEFNDVEMLLSGHICLICGCPDFENLYL